MPAVGWGGYGLRNGPDGRWRRRPPGPSRRPLRPRWRPRGHTVLEVLVEHRQGEGAQGLVDRRGLREDVDAVLVVLDHALKSTDLTLDTAQPVDVPLLVIAVTVGRRHGPT